MKAKGDVLFLSVESLEKSGITDTPVVNLSPVVLFNSSPSTIALITLFKSSPTNAETIAGGASLAPSLWSLPAHAADNLNNSAYSSTPLRAHARVAKKGLLLIGSGPGLNKLIPVLVINDQLLCLPEPLTPSNGFSCNKHLKPCFFAIS